MTKDIAIRRTLQLGAEAAKAMENAKTSRGLKTDTATIERALLAYDALDGMSEDEIQLAAWLWGIAKEETTNGVLVVQRPDGSTTRVLLPILKRGHTTVSKPG
ncbi:MAG: hypothetical protein P4M15_12085 [Alphaproteobacteria bacterium]|nr:hypothetical protein [Alphaproteobacteria bacterium]